VLFRSRLDHGHTGIEAIHALRAAFGQEIPAILITGDSAPSTIKALNDSGLPILHKPLKPAKLRALLSHMLARRAV
jgi:CheY-like chemotaxis protein